MGTLIKRNFLSDFCFYLDLYDRDGEKLGFPDCNFKFTVTSGWGGRKYTGFRHGKRMVNVAEHDGRLLIICNAHNLIPGRVSVEICLSVPNPVFPDGFEDTVKQTETNIELVTGNSDDDCPGSAEMTLPIVGMKSECGCEPIEEATEEDIIGIAEEIFKEE